MKRRNFVRVMLTTLAAPKLLLSQQGTPNPPLPAPVPWILGLNARTPVPPTQVPDVVAQGDLRFFTALQMASLERLSDLLVPSLAGKPGALAAEVPAFLDFFVGQSAPSRRHLYQHGLDWLEAEAQRQCSLPFAQLKPEQADRILQPWMRTWMTDHPPTEPHADFINIAHAEIRQATVNSKAWSEIPATKDRKPPSLGLYWLPVEPDLQVGRAGCLHPRSPACKAAL